MVRTRYWKLTPEEFATVKYDQSKVLNWDMKCIKEPEEDAKFVGIFLYKEGTVMDYNVVHGITYFHNNYTNDELKKVTSFLKKKFGGQITEKGSRIFLKDSKEIYTPSEIVELAKEMTTQFDTKPVLTIEFKDLTEEEIANSGFPQNKLLPIPTK